MASRKPQNDLQIAKIKLLEGTLQPIDGGEQMFSFGYELDRIGHRDAAEAVYRQTIEVLESLSSGSSEATGKLSLSNLASLAKGHGIKMYELGRYDEAKGCFIRAVEVIDSMIVLDACLLQIEDLAASLNWLGLTLRKTKEYSRACDVYQRSISIWRSVIRFSPVFGKTDIYRTSLAAALLGYAKCLSKEGQHGLAQRSKAEARRLMRGTRSASSYEFVASRR